MTDRELLEDAAKAAGIVVGWDRELNKMFFDAPSKEFGRCGITFDPLTDDGDALRLAVTLRMSVMNTTIRTNILVRPRTEFGDWIDISEPHGDDPLAATRRAIVRAAAAIGKEMK
jgi:hypothetical protein